MGRPNAMGAPRLRLEERRESGRRSLRKSEARLQPHRSQSEADWAYAKRALARGDSPEEVVRRIADYRSDDKTDPHYYARHTVTKAQIQMRSEIQLSQGKTAPDIQRDQE